MKTMKAFILIWMILFWAVPGFTETIRLKTEDLNECIEIKTFLSNTKGEIFLYSGRTSKIFKFKKNGEFEKSFCRYGIGPGEVKRVLWMYYNPSNNLLYLPEFYSGIPRISIFDCDGNFKNYLDIDISPSQKNLVSKITFLYDGSFYVVLDERIDWEPHGGLYLTKDKNTLLYFDKNGKLISKILETIQNDELSDKPRWGGPRILFSPSTLIRKTPEGKICTWKTDEKILQFYDKTGAKVGTTTMQMERMPLSDSEFNAKKEAYIKYLEREPRMRDLVKKMIKLKYKPIHDSFLIVEDHYIFIDYKENASGYTKETTLTTFDINGKKVSSKTVKGLVMNISDHRLYIKEYDEEDNEHFRIEDF